MRGVSWDEKEDGWWLASNGKWYAPQHYPRAWSRSALPPAPNQRDDSVSEQIMSRMRRVQDGLGGSDGYGPPPDDAIMHSGEYESATSERRRPSTVREAAEATVTSQRTHSSRLPSGAPPMPAIGSGPPPPGVPPPPSRPPPPGRIHDDDDEYGDDDEELSPAAVVAGDFGRILGSARARIERAIEDSASTRSTD